MTSYEERLRRIKLGLPPSEEIATYTDISIVSASHPLAQWLAQTFNHNFDAYDTAIDQVYNTTHIGGSSYHHIIDGQHDILGAFRAVKDVRTDDSFLKELTEASEHLLRDTASVSGINPLFSLTENQFNKLADLCGSIGISKPYLADALTFNGPELIGGSIALIASLALAKNQDPYKLSSLSGAYIISSLASANPILLPIAAGGLVYSLRKSEDKKASLIKAGKGSIVSGGAILMSGLVGGPLWLSCITAVSTAIAVRYTLDNPHDAFERVKSVMKPANEILKKVSVSI